MRLGLAFILLTFLLNGCATTGGAGQSGVVPSRDGMFTVNLPPHWQTINTGDKDAVFRAARKDRRGYVMIYDADYDRIDDNIDELADSLAKGLAKDMQDGTASKPLYGHIGDMNAVLYLIKGSYNQYHITHWLVIIKGDKALYVAKAWCQEEDFHAIGDDLFKVIMTLRET